MLKGYYSNIGYINTIKCDQVSINLQLNIKEIPYLSPQRPLGEYFRYYSQFIYSKSDFSPNLKSVHLAVWNSLGSFSCKHEVKTEMAAHQD